MIFRHHESLIRVQIQNGTKIFTIVRNKTKEFVNYMIMFIEALHKL